jgi:EAL domain-containing protein (putative c-di-GMP-specific phosphodiesterase class I)
VLQTGAHTIKTLQALRAMGVPTALDDFGTGYSSLASLERLPLSRVKLDRSLVDAIDGSPRAAAIARAIISLCEGLGLHVTAEGVERITQFEMLLRHQPLMLQGFLLSRPLPEGEVAAARASIPPRLTALLLTMPEDTQLRLPVLPPAALDEAAGTG